MQESRSSWNKIQQSYFCLPEWWVRAFEQGVAERPKKPSFCADYRQIVGPGLACDELALLPNVLTSLQDSMLQRQLVHVVRIAPNVLLKEGGIHTRAKMNAYARLIRSIGSMHVFGEDLHGKRSRIDFFAEETISQENNEVAIELKPSEACFELLTGYVDAYSDHFRRVSDKATPLLGVVSKLQPLILKRSLWLELGGIDHLLYLRVEKAVQWFSKCLDLDGTFAEEFVELFRDTSTYFSLSKELTFKKGLRLFERLAKKMVQHGLIDRSPVDGFQALNNSEPPLQLIWRSFDPIHQDFAQTGFADQVAERICSSSHHKRALKGALSMDTRFNLGNRSGKMSEVVDKLYEQHSSSFTREESFEPIWLRRGCRVYSLVGLYLEWVLRKGKDCSDPLDPSQVGRDLYDLLPSFEVSVKSHQEKFARFLSEILHNERLRDGFIFGGQLSLVEQDLVEVYSTKNDDLKDSIDVSANISKNSLGSRNERVLQKLDSEESEIRESKDLDRFVGGVSEDENQRNQSVSRGSDQLGDPENNKKNELKSHLSNMKKHSRSQYLGLTNEYLGSLEENARKVILSIKERMEPNVFEQHIEQRLLKYLSSQQLNSYPGERFASVESH